MKHQEQPVSFHPSRSGIGRTGQHIRNVDDTARYHENRDFHVPDCLRLSIRFAVVDVALLLIFIWPILPDSNLQPKHEHEFKRCSALHGQAAADETQMRVLLPVLNCLGYSSYPSLVLPARVVSLAIDNGEPNLCQLAGSAHPIRGPDYAS
jgi:hypothetical protein